MASTSVADRLGLEKGPHELRLGKSFGKDSKNYFHTIRYDFKPASVDTNEDSTVVVGGDGAVEVTVPHVQGAGTTHTVYKGNKRPLQKECVLIINHDTGEISLEKLSYAVQLKKTRAEPSARLNTSQRPVTPIDKARNSPHYRPTAAKPSPTSGTTSYSQSKPPAAAAATSSSPDAIFTAAEKLGVTEEDMDISSSSSSSGSSDSDSSSSDSESEAAPPSAGHSRSPKAVERSMEDPGPTHYLQTLSQDLRLSESSDDDSD